MAALIPVAVKVTVFALMLVVGLDCTRGDLMRQPRPAVLLFRLAPVDRRR